MANKNLIRIVAATSMAVFALFACFSGTVAWFLSQSNLDNSGDNFSVYAGSSIHLLSAYAVRYDGDKGAVASDLLSSKQSIAMSEYDYIFRDRNVNTPLFFRLELTGFDSSKDLTITIPCTGAYKKSGTTITDNYLSNVICAKFLRGLKGSNGVVSVDDSDFSSDAGIRQSYEGMLRNGGDYDGSPFVTSSSEKNMSIQLTLDKEDAFDEDFLLEKEDEQGNSIDVAVVFIEFDYYVTSTTNLVEDYISSYSGSDHSLFFRADIPSMTLDNQ